MKSLSLVVCLALAVGCSKPAKPIPATPTAALDTAAALPIPTHDKSLPLIRSYQLDLKTAQQHNGKVIRLVGMIEKVYDDSVILQEVGEGYSVDVIFHPRANAARELKVGETHGFQGRLETGDFIPVGSIPLTNAILIRTAKSTSKTSK